MGNSKLPETVYWYTGVPKEPGMYLFQSAKCDRHNNIIGLMRWDGKNWIDFLRDKRGIGNRKVNKKHITYFAYRPKGPS